MRPRKPAGTVDKVEQNMTPMIDIVFQLLAFFVMTFKIASIEGNFDIKMPLAAAGAASQIIPPIKIRLQATANGGCQILMDNRTIGSFESLRYEIRKLVGGSGPAMGDVEVELDPDYNLRFEHVINAITAVSGYVTNTDQGPAIVKLVEKIKFSQPRKPAG